MTGKKTKWIKKTEFLPCAKKYDVKNSEKADERKKRTKKTMQKIADEKNRKNA